MPVPLNASPSTRHPARRIAVVPGILGRLGLNFGVLRYSRRAVALVWSTNRSLTLLLTFFTVSAGLLPAAAAWVGKLVIDTILAQMALAKAGAVLSYLPVLELVVTGGPDHRPARGRTAGH